MASHAPPKHRAVLQRWVASLAEIPSIDAVWLEGSLVTDRANPGADIDLRVAIADAAYDELWERDRSPLLIGLGEYLLLGTGFIRALTEDGLIVEAAPCRTTELAGLALYEWEILFSRLPTGEPAVKKLPPSSPPSTWPAREPLSVAEVCHLTNMALVVMATAPATLYTDEVHSARFILDDLRTELIRIMYRRIGLVYAKRFKHLSTVLPAAFLNDLAGTHLPAGAAPFDKHAIATALTTTFDVLGQHLQALSDQAGGGFESAWYGRLYQQSRAELSAF